MIVLLYIRNRSKRLKTFVANIIATIHEGSLPEQWRHVDSFSNPADDASRGLSAVELVSCQRWSKGPDFLWQDKENWLCFLHLFQSWPQINVIESLFD